MNKKIEFLTKNLNKKLNPDRNIKIKIKDFIEVDLPDDYTNFIGDYSYLEGEIGKNGYICLWGNDELIEMNINYEMKEFFSDFFLIGSNLGGTGYAINIKTGEFVEFDLNSIDEPLKKGNNFIEFLESFSS